MVQCSIFYGEGTGMVMEYEINKFLSEKLGLRDLKPKDLLVVYQAREASDKTEGFEHHAIVFFPAIIAVEYEKDFKEGH